MLIESFSPLSWDRDLHMLSKCSTTDLYPQPIFESLH
jgi:hypothetical protein